MAKTKEINLIYKITPKEVIAPSEVDLDRKDKWIDTIKKTIPSEWDYQLIKVRYSLYDPNIDDMLRFFNGTIVMYYAIQNEDMTEGLPSNETLKRYREQILQAVLGYDVRLGKLIGRERASLTEFREVQQLFNFVNVVKEELFDPNGYEFPDSEEFNKIVQEFGHEVAKETSIKKLQLSLKRKLYGDK